MSYLRLVLVIAFVFTVGAPAATANLLLIDGSGSMDGFFRTGSLEKVARLFVGSDLKNADVWFFGNGDPVHAGEEFKRPQGLDPSFTRIGDAFAWAMEHKSHGDIWVITDNIYDDGNATTSSRQQSEFYDLIRDSDRVLRLSIFPVSLRFDGRVFGPPNEYGEEQVYGTLNGYQGVLIYHFTIIPPGVGDEEIPMDREMASDRKFVKALESLRQNRIIKRYAAIPFKPPLQGEDIEPVWVAPNAKVSEYGVETVLTPIGTNRLSTDGLVKLDKDRTITGGIALQFQSRFQNVDIERAHIEMLHTGFTTSDFDCGEFTVRIQPDSLVQLRSQSKADQIYYIMFHIENIDFRRTLQTYMGAWLKPHWSIDGNIGFKIDMQASQMSLTKDLADQFDIPNAYSFRLDNDGRIYRLGDLLQRVNPARLQLQSEEYTPVHIDVKYPASVLAEVYAILIVLVAIAALLVFLLIRFLKRVPLLEVEGPAGTYRSGRVYFSQSLPLKTETSRVGTASASLFGLGKVKITPAVNAKRVGERHGSSDSVTISYDRGLEKARFRVRLVDPGTDDASATSSLSSEPNRRLM